jgi:hypothetical protein
MARRDDWKHTLRVELEKRMFVTGADVRDSSNDAYDCAIDMYGLHFLFHIEKLDDHYWIEYGLHGSWSADPLLDMNTDAVVKSIRMFASSRTECKWLYWQKLLVTALCDRGVVSGVTGQVADNQHLKIMLSDSKGSSYFVDIHWGAAPDVSYDFVSCSNPAFVLIRREWNNHPPNIDALVPMIFKDLGNVSAIASGEQAPIHIGPGKGSKIVSGAGGGAAKLRLYEAVVDILILYRSRDMSEESINTVSELLHHLKENLDTGSQ